MGGLTGKQLLCDVCEAETFTTGERDGPYGEMTRAAASNAGWVFDGRGDVCPDCVSLDPLKRAIAIASEAHSGQIDKAGAPYIMHPLRVAGAVPEGDCKIVAVLHDVVEDSPWTLEQLRAEGFSEAVLAGVDAVTRREDETYMQFVERAARDPIGRVVKRADLIDNMDTTRLGEITESDRSRLDRYARALDRMGASA